MPTTNDLWDIDPTLEGVEVTLTLGTRRRLPTQIERIADRVIKEGHPNVVLKERASHGNAYQTKVRLGDNCFEVQQAVTGMEIAKVKQMFEVWFEPAVPKSQRVLGPTCGAAMLKGNVATPLCCEPPGHYPATLHRGNGSYADSTWGEPE